MKAVFLAPRGAVDLLVGRCLHHAVLTESGDWLVVAEIPDVELRDQVLKAATLELPHPASGVAPSTDVVDALAAPAAAVDPEAPAPAPVEVQLPPASTRELVVQTVDRLGMPALLELLDR